MQRSFANGMMVAAAGIEDLRRSLGRLAHVGRSGSALARAKRHRWQVPAAREQGRGYGHALLEDQWAGYCCHARLRSRARSKRRQKLMNQRAGKDHAFNWGFVGLVFMLIFALVLNGMAAWFVSKVSETVVRLQLEREGKVAMSPWFYQRLASEHHAMQRIVPELARLKAEKARLKRGRIRLPSNGPRKTWPRRTAGAAGGSWHSAGARGRDLGPRCQGGHYAAAGA